MGREMTHHASNDDDTLVYDPAVEQLDDAPANGAGPPAESGPSILGRLRERREELGKQRTMDLEVPGTKGLLVLRLAALPRDRLTALTQRAIKGTSVDANLNADTLIAACVEVLARNSRAEPLGSLGEAGEPVRIDDRLGSLLGLPEASRARDVLQAVFAMAPSPDMAIGVACGQYMEWASATAEETDEEFVGE